MMNAAFSLQNKNTLVTGGTRGIGRAISIQFARAGAKVIANYVRGQEAADTLLAQAKQENLAITICRADITSANGLSALESAIDAQGASLNCLVHCAATGVHKSIDELTLRHFDWTFALNVRAFFELVKRFLPRFTADSCILALSSQCLFAPFPHTRWSGLQRVLWKHCHAIWPWNWHHGELGEAF